MSKQRTINPKSDFDGSIAKAMPKVQDKVDAYPESVKSTIVSILFMTNFFPQCRIINLQKQAVPESQALIINMKSK